MRRLHQDESGAALVVALIATVVMLGLGLALVSIVDAQNTSSATERTRDRGFNLTETVLTSEGFVLGRNWPADAVTSGAGTLATPLEQDCSAVGATVNATLGASPAAGTAAALIQANLNAVYTDTAYSGATWKVNVCDDNGSSPPLWDEATLSNHTKNWDKNQNNVVWVRAEATVKGVRRAVAGLVQARRNTALQPAFGLVSGNISEDLSAASSAISNTTVVSGLTSQLITTNPVVAPDPSSPGRDPSTGLLKSGVTGLRCGLLSNPSLQKTCVTGTIGALSAVPAVNTLVTNGAFTQYPTTTSADPGTIGQLRAQSKAKGTYTLLSAGGASSATAPACTITGTPTSETVVFIETVGTGDQWCLIDVTTSRQYKALVIGSGRVVFRGDNNASAPTVYSATAASNLFTGVVYALALQIPDASASPTAANPAVEVVRIEKGTRIRGTVNADSKRALVATIPPDFNTQALATSVMCAPPGLLCTSAPLVNTLGVSAAIDLLVNGGCLGTKVGSACVGVTVAGYGAPAVAASLSSQMSTYGSPIHSDVAVVKALTVYGASGVVPGTFEDLQPSL